MRQEIKTRILWISDIHINSGYSKKNLEIIDSYFNCFFGVIKDEPPFDYIILNGDIAFNGTEVDYNCFGELFFNRLILSKHNKAKLLVVPGNHDISREDSTNLGENLGNDKSLIYKERNNYLSSKNVVSYTQNFSHFSNYFNKKSSYFSESINDTYKSHKLYGYEINKEKRIIFILLNSAWFSLGKAINKLLISKNKRKNGESDDDFANRLLKIKDVISEYGSQLIGANLLNELNLITDLIEKHSDFTVISIMHHPPNWIPWQEKYSYKKDHQEGMIFNIIMKVTNFLLTGHEHVLGSKSREIIDFNSNSFHLKAGCLIDEIKEDTNFYHLTQNRFSILEINNGKNNFLKEKVFNYTPKEVEKDIWEHEWEHTFNNPIFYSLKFCRTSPDDNIYLFNLENFLIQRNVSNLENLIKIENDNSPFYIYKINENYYYVSKHYIENLNIEIYNILNRIKTENTKQIVHFIIKDTHVCKDLYRENKEKNYDEIRQHREIIFDKHNNFQINQFDKIRNTIFTEFDSNPSYDFKKINNLCLVIEMIPYWIFEDFSLG